MNLQLSTENNGQKYGALNSVVYSFINPPMRIMAFALVSAVRVTPRETGFGRPNVTGPGPNGSPSRDESRTVDHAFEAGHRVISADVFGCGPKESRALVARSPSD